QDAFDVHDGLRIVDVVVAAADVQGGRVAEGGDGGQLEVAGGGDQAAVFHVDDGDGFLGREGVAGLGHHDQRAAVEGGAGAVDVDGRGAAGSAGEFDGTFVLVGDGEDAAVGDVDIGDAVKAVAEDSAFGDVDGGASAVDV